MKKISLILISLFLSACTYSTNSTHDYEAIDYLNKPEIKTKTPEEWIAFVNEASEKNDDIASYLDTRTCIPTSSTFCKSNGICEDAEPSIFFFVTTFDPKSGYTSSLTRHVYLCTASDGCNNTEYSSYTDKNETLKLQAKNNEIDIDKDSNYTEEIAISQGKTINKGKCYWRDEFTIASKKVDSMNVRDEICTVDEGSFGIDWIGIDGKFVLKNNTELRASPIVMDCNILATIPKGQIIDVQFETEGAFNGEDSFHWLKINFEGQTGWVRGDYLDDQFKM